MRAMKEAGDEDGLERIEMAGGASRLGTLYRKDLQLTADDKDLLKSIRASSGNFCQITQCKGQTVKLFVEVWRQQSPSYKDQIGDIAKAAGRKVYNYRKNSDYY